MKNPDSLFDLKNEKKGIKPNHVKLGKYTRKPICFTFRGLNLWRRKHGNVSFTQKTRGRKKTTLQFNGLTQI